jgi:hypothetical protein
MIHPGPFLITLIGLDEVIEFDKKAGGSAFQVI